MSIIFFYGSLVKTFNVAENIDNLCEYLPKQKVLSNK